jgi:hypothetical protein
VLVVADGRVAPINQFSSGWLAKEPASARLRANPAESLDRESLWEMLPTGRVVSEPVVEADSWSVGGARGYLEHRGGVLAAVDLIEELHSDTSSVELRINSEPVDVDSISGAPVAHQADEPASLIPRSYQRELEPGDIGGGLMQRRDAVEADEVGLDLVCGVLHASDLGCYGCVTMIEFAQGVHVLEHWPPAPRFAS